MRSYGAMAGRYLKQQRKRTLLTIVGIVLSVALISALGTMGQTLKDNFIANTKNTDGSFYFGYSKPTPELYDTLRKNLLVDRLGYYRSGESTALDGSVAVAVGALDEDGLELLPIHLHEGRLPRQPDEVILETWLLEHLPGNPGLNDTVSLSDLEGRQREYRIVGLLNNEKNSQVNAFSRAFTYADEATKLTVDENTLLVLTLKPGVDISDQIEAFTKLNDSLFTNFELLAIMGESGDHNLTRVLVVIFGTLIGLVVLSTVAVIYNAFHIAVLERVRQFGLLRTLGASPGQIRNLVLREAAVLSAIGVPLGLIVGWFGLWLVLRLMSEAGMRILMMDTFELTFHWWIMAGSLAVGFLAVYLAAWLPARKASSVSPVDAAKGAGSIVRESYRRMKIPSPLSLAGIEGKMASNNVRRNRTKFRITTFSIMVSIILFIVFHYFTQQMLTLTTTTNENDRVAFQLTRAAIVDSEGNEGNAAPDPVRLVPDEMIREIAELPGVYGAYGLYPSLALSTLVPDDVFNPDLVEKTDLAFPRETLDGEEGIRVPTRVVLYDEARFAEAANYLRAGTANPAELAEEDGVLILQTVKPLQRDGKRAILDLARFQAGDSLTIRTQASALPEVTVKGILSESPFGSSYSEGQLTVIATKPTFAKLLAAASDEYPASDYHAERYGVEVALKDGADAEPIRAKLKEIARLHPGTSLIDYAENQKETRNFNMQMRIFVYGFILVIGLIGSLNIINTVQTNLLLRRREIGLLQAVGMTMGQIRRMATAEGLWFGVIGSFWGILIGSGFTYFLYVQLSNVQGFPFEFPWGASLIACAAALLVGLFAVQGPLRRMEKANLLEELREEA